MHALASRMHALVVLTVPQTWLQYLLRAHQLLKFLYDSQRRALEECCCKKLIKQTDYLLTEILSHFITSPCRHQSNITCETVISSFSAARSLLREIFNLRKTPGDDQISQRSATINSEDKLLVTASWQSGMSKYQQEKCIQASHTAKNMIPYRTFARKTW